MYVNGTPTKGNRDIYGERGDTVRRRARYHLGHLYLVVVNSWTPLMTSAPIVNAIANITYVYQATSNDTSVTYVMYTDAAFLRIDPSTAEITGHLASMAHTMST